MLISVISIPLLVAFVLPGLSPAQSGMPTMRSVDPTGGRSGDLLVIRGENLGTDRIARLYLTDGQADVPATIVEQTADSIKFRIPAGLKPGRFALLVLTKDAPPQLIEEPVKITVEPDTTALIALRNR